MNHSTSPCLSRSIANAGNPSCETADDRGHPNIEECKNLPQYCHSVPPENQFQLHENLAECLSGSKLFWRWFCSCWCISVAAWTQLKDVQGSFLWFRFVWWLDCLLLKEGASAFCCLKCFLLLRSLWVFAQAVGFHLNDCIEYFTAPCWPPLPL